MALCSTFYLYKKVKRNKRQTFLQPRLITVAINDDLLNYGSLYIVEYLLEVIAQTLTQGKRYKGRMFYDITDV